MTRANSFKENLNASEMKGLEDLNFRRLKINSDIFSYAFASFLDNEKMKEDYKDS